jgi:hypothetical protein
MGRDGIGEELVMGLEEALRSLIAHALHEGGRVHEVREQDRGDRGTRGLAHWLRSRCRMMEQMRVGGDTRA